MDPRESSFCCSMDRRLQSPWCSFVFKEPLFKNLSNPHMHLKGKRFVFYFAILAVSGAPQWCPASSPGWDRCVVGTLGFPHASFSFLKAASRRVCVLAPRVRTCGNLQTFQARRILPGLLLPRFTPWGFKAGIILQVRTCLWPNLSTGVQVPGFSSLNMFL